MPGTESEISAEAFYEAFADFLMPVVEASETIGFCFSYPAEIMPDCDARLIHWTKQIKVPSVVGTLIGSGLQEQLAKRGFKRKAVILNDTVATLLAGKSAGVAKDYSAYVGFILGTGTNRSEPQ
jgi:hexokinase